MAEAARTYREGDLDFTFDATWSVARHWDNEPVRLALHAQATGSRGVDFVAVRAGAPHLFLIEVKDYRVSEGLRSTREKVADGGAPLAEIVAQKVRDTVAGLIGAGRADRDPDWQETRRALVDKREQVYVVLWIEHVGVAGVDAVRRKRQSVSAGVLEESIRERCRWLSARARVCSRDGLCLPGLTVKSVAGAQRVRGRRR